MNKHNGYYLPSLTEVFGMTTSDTTPNANAQDCGGKTIGAADLIPNIPATETAFITHRKNKIR